MLAHDARKAVSAAHRSRRRMYRILLRPTALQAGRTANRPAARPYHLDGSRGSHPNLQTLASQRSRATEVSHTSSASRALQIARYSTPAPSPSIEIPGSYLAGLLPIRLPPWIIPWIFASKKAYGKCRSGRLTRSRREDSSAGIVNVSA
jgi:hypothetical protein